jgi:hypothetical protein
MNQLGFASNLLSVKQDANCSSVIIMQRHRFGVLLKTYYIVGFSARICTCCIYSIGNWLSVYDITNGQYVLCHLPSGYRYKTVKTEEHVEQQMASCHQHYWLYSSWNDLSIFQLFPKVRLVHHCCNMYNVYYFDMFCDSRLYARMYIPPDMHTIRIDSNGIEIEQIRFQQGKLAIRSSQHKYFTNFCGFFQCADLFKLFLTFLPEQYMSYDFS